MGIFTAIAFALSVVSAVYQQSQQRKMRKKAEAARRAAEEARKGFETVVDSEIIALPIVYGRAKIGGNRVFSKTSNSFSLGTSNADKVFNVGGLNTSYSGEKNEILLTQQAICQGPIHACHDLIIDDSIQLNDPTLSRKAEEGETTGAFRAEIHYDGGEACNTMTRNAGERALAKFTGAAFASFFIKLNRDDPQFSGVPDIALLIEGRLVRTVTAGVLSAGRVYSNNPAWVLLDYLLDFRKVPVEDLILESFESAATICDTQVLSSAYTGGNIFRNALGDRNITTRAIPLYEANIIIDSKKPHRENVEAILETMGDARLVWSQGRYKLSLQYPGVNNTGIIVSEFIDDSRLVMGEDVNISWPSAEDRYNNVTIRYSNEAENFKEDTVSWPPKPLGSYTKGIGAKVYPAVSGWDTSTGGRFLNNYGVWNGNTSAVTLTWNIYPTITGTYTLDWTIDDRGDLLIDEYDLTGIPYVNVTSVGTITKTFLDSFNGPLWRRLTRNKNAEWKTLNNASVTLEANKLYRITINATDTSGLKGAAASLKGPDGLTFWTTRDPSFSGFETIDKSNAVYLEMLAEDNNVELEGDLFFEGCTDYYHALAKAEELVRTSRSAFKVKFSYHYKDVYLEPGDVIQFSSETVKIGSTSAIYLKVDNVNMKSGLVAEVEATRFDWTQLAWNVADSEYIKPTPSYNFDIAAPLFLEYKPDVTDVFDGPGSLDWPLVYDSRVKEYNLYVNIPGEITEEGFPKFKRLGTTSAPPFSLPPLETGFYKFGVKSVTSTGAMSVMTITDTTNLVRLPPPIPSEFSVTTFGDRAQSVRLSWTIPTNRVDGSEYKNHFTTEVFRSKINNISLAQKIGDVSYSTSFIDTPSEYGQLYYWIRFVSYAGVSGEFSSVSSAEVSFWEVFNESAYKPPAPSNLQAIPGFGQILLKWDRTDYSQGGGHSMSLIYAKDWPDGEPQPVFNNDYLVASVPFAEIYSHAVSPGSRWVYWIKELSRGSGVSDGFAGPVSATSEETVTDILGALTSNGFDTNTEPFIFFATETTLPDGTVIQPGTYLKRGFIADLSVDDAKIKNVSADKLYTGFLSADRIESQSLDATKIDTRGLTVRDEFGNIILGAGTGLDWSNVTGSGRPENGATVGADSSNLRAGPGVNMVFNGDYTDGLAGTVVGWRSGGNQHVLGRNNASYFVQGEGTAYIMQPGTPGAGVVFDANIWNGQSGQHFAVTPGKKYEISAWLNCHRCEGRMGVLFLDAAGAQLWHAVGNAVTHGSLITSIADMRQSWAIVTAPATAVKAYLIVRGYNTGLSDPYVFFSRVYFGEAGAGQTEPSLWTPGRGISQITTSNVSTYIANAAIGAAQIGSIELVGESAFKVRTNNTTGARMDMDSRRIKIFDASGTLRVQIGDLTV